MNKGMLFLLILINLVEIQAQSATIVYNRKPNWSNIVRKMPYLSQEEKDRILISWGKSTYKGDEYILNVNDKGSIYMEKEKEQNFEQYWWNEKDEDILIRDFETKQTKDIRILLGKKYLIEDETPRYKWKILNELKEVAGYVCMKAETKDTTNNIIINAWFTDKIPFKGGPEGIAGLPGMILSLEYNEDDMIITAESIKLSETTEPLPIPAKMKGKALTYAEYNKKKANHIKLSIEGRRNPYWDLRY